MAKSVKLEDIARCVGVSKVTVSKALANKSGVSEALRERIRIVAKQMGYVPISVQKAKLDKHTGNIGVIIPYRFIDNNTSFYWALYQNLVTKLQLRGYYTIIELISDESEMSCELPKLLQDGKVDGLVMIGQPINTYSEFLWKNSVVPMMFLDFYDTHMEYDTVITDGFYGMYLLTNYLISMGHTKIGFVGTIFATSSITDRYFGYRKALLEHGLSCNDSWVLPDRESQTKEVSIKLPEELPTAFACNSDYTAHVLISLLSERGINVPRDISVVGFDNYLHPNLLNIELTTYEVPMDTMAELCIKTLIRKINHKEYIKGVQIITGNMIIKNTVAVISKASI